MTDWPSFIASLGAPSGLYRLDPEEIWRRFISLAHTSPHAEALEFLINYSMGLPSEGRAGIAVALAFILKDVDWPPAWEVRRQELLQALDELLHEMNPSVAGTAASQIPIWRFPPDYLAWKDILILVRHFLDKPCRRDELRLVTSLCNRALPICIRTWRQAWGQAEKAGQPTSGMATFAYHLSRYDVAARNLNQATGEVLLSTMGPITPEY